MFGRIMAGALALACIAGPAAAQTVVIDPACFEAVGWEVDPASEAIRINGCRPASEIPAPGPDGFITYQRPPQNGTDAGFIRAKLLSVGPGGAVTFEVQDNGGGSGTFALRVTGVPGPDGVLRKDGLKVDALPGD